jgi:glutamine amidotransferase
MSMSRMIEKAGGKAVLAREPKELCGCDRLVLPGVGAFDFGMAALRAGDWIETLERQVFGLGVPILGVCLGMQLMCRASEEGRSPGLGWIPADVIRFRQSEHHRILIPHMGWNTVRVEKRDALIPKDDRERRYYFVHSYHVHGEPQDTTLATVEHGYRFTAAFSSGKILGAQFHPEKSHRFGLEVLQRFIQSPC